MVIELMFTTTQERNQVLHCQVSCRQHTTLYNLCRPNHEDYNHPALVLTGNSSVCGMLSCRDSYSQVEQPFLSSYHKKRRELLCGFSTGRILFVRKLATARCITVAVRLKHTGPLPDLVLALICPPPSPLLHLFCWVCLWLDFHGSGGFL